MSTRLFREYSPWQTWAKIWSSILWFKPMHAWRIQAARIEAARIESPRIQAVRIQTARIQAARIETIWGWKQDVGGEFRRRDAQCRFLRRWHNWSGRLQSQSSTSAFPLAPWASAWTWAISMGHQWQNHVISTGCIDSTIQTVILWLYGNSDKQVSRLNFLWGLWMLSLSEEEWEPEKIIIYEK